MAFNPISILGKDVNKGLNMNISKYQPLDILEAIWNSNFNHNDKKTFLYDVTQEADKFIITADLPGVKIDDIKITVEDQVLMIDAVRKKPFNSGFNEVQYNQRFNLAKNLDTDQIQATLSDGILNIDIPKLKLKTAKNIVINTRQEQRRDDPFETAA